MLPLSLSYDHRVDRRRRRHPLPALGRRRVSSTRSCSSFSRLLRLPEWPIRLTSRSSAPGPAAMPPPSSRRSRHAGHARRRGEEPRRRLPLSRLHPVEGAAPRRQGARARRGTPRSGASSSRRRASTSTSCARSRTASSSKMTGGTGVLTKLRKIHYVQGRATFVDADARSSVALTARRGRARSPSTSAFSPPARGRRRCRT